MKDSEIVVHGMTCSSCAHGVRMALARIDGVTVVDVDVRTGRVRLRHDAAPPSAEHLRTTLAAAGYELGASD